MKRYKFYILTLLTCLVTSCENDNTDNEGMSSNIINFTTNIVETKGELVSSDNFDNFGVYGNDTYSDYTFSNTKIYKNDDNYWSYDNPEKWVQDKSLFFQAYAPYGTSDNGVTPIIYEGTLFASYTVPSICSNQPDLMLAKSVSYYESAVALSFVHTLASVQFNVKGFSSSVKVKSIEFMGNIAVSGVVGLDSSGTPDWTWVEESESASFFVNIDDDHLLDPTEENSVITNDGYLMMIPYSYSADEVRINIVLEDDGVSEEITYLFSEDITWQAGVSYSYTLERDIREITLDYTSDDDSNCYMIHPYNRVTQNIYIPISSRINDFWQNYSGESDFTAVTAETTLSAEVLWYDTNLNSYVSNSLEEVGFDVECVDNGYMNTECAKALLITLPDGLTDGNVLVGVKDEDGKILWSWHLWITSYNPDVTPLKLQSIYGGGDCIYTVTNGYVHRYAGTLWESGDYANSYIMGRNLGEWEAMGTDYNLTRGVMFQFGRKDPFLGSVGVDYTVASGGAVSFATATTNPTTFYTTDSADWCSEGLGGSYLWNDSSIASTSTSGKSIFDPSPLGWRLPVYGTWNDLQTGTGVISDFYYKPDGVSGNYILYKNLGFWDSTTGVFIDTDSGSHNDSIYTYVWSATGSSSSSSGYCLLVTPTNAAYEITKTRSFGYYVRPIREY